MYIKAVWCIASNREVKFWLKQWEMATEMMLLDTAMYHIQLHTVVKLRAL